MRILSYIFFCSAEANLLGAKAFDYADFIKMIELMNKKLHLTPAGLAQIRKRIKNVNSKRS